MSFPPFSTTRSMPYRPVSEEPCFPGLVSELLSVLLPLPRFFPLKIPIPMPPHCGSPCLPLGSWTVLCLLARACPSGLPSHSRSTPTHTYNPSGQSRQGESEEENPAASQGSEMCKSTVAPQPVDSGPGRACEWLAQGASTLQAAVGICIFR